MRPIIVGVGGAHSGAGKTTYAAMLLSRFKGWGAIKETKTALYSAVVDDVSVLSEENKDTRKFLDAGAHRVVWVKSPASELGEALLLALDRLRDVPGVVVEGNSAIEFLEPDIIIFIFGDSLQERKESARTVIEKADVIIAEGYEPVPGCRARIFGRTASETGEFLSCVAHLVEEKEEIRSSLRKHVVDGKVPCAVARKIAEELSVPYGDVGKTANELEIKIKDCELGCF